MNKTTGLMIAATSLVVISLVALSKRDATRCEIAEAEAAHAHEWGDAARQWSETISRYDDGGVGVIVDASNRDELEESRHAWFWVLMPTPVDFYTTFGGFGGDNLVVTEVGFICLYRGGGGFDPYCIHRDARRPDAFCGWRGPVGCHQ